MNRRTFEEMVSYFNQTVADMDIDRKYKIELLGMITAILQRHDEDMKHALTIEPKKGKWHSRIYSKIEMFVCSECQHEYSYDAETGEQFYNYCTNCGSYNGGDTWGH